MTKALLERRREGWGGSERRQRGRKRERQGSQLKAKTNIQLFSHLADVSVKRLQIQAHQDQVGVRGHPALRGHRVDLGHRGSNTEPFG